MRSPVWSSEENNKLIAKRILGYRNTAISIELFTTFLRQNFLAGYTKDDAYLQAFSALCTAPKAKKEPTFVPHKILPAVTLALWMKEARMQKPPVEIVEFLGWYREELRNEIKPLLSSFLLTIQTLHTVSIAKKDKTYLSDNDKLALLQYVCNPLGESKDMEAMTKKLSLLSAIASLSPESVFSIDKSLPPLSHLRDVFYTQLGSIFSFSDLSIDEVIQGYEKTFGLARYPYALGTYMSTIPENADTSTLKKFVHDVITGKFLENRYKTEGHPHLTFLQEHAPEFFSKWKALQIEKEITLSGKTEPTSLSLLSFFQDKLAHRHWHTAEEDKLPALTAFLQNVEPLTPPSTLETLIIELLKKGKDLSLTVLTEELQEILPLCKKEELELANDIQGLLTSTKEGHKTVSALFTVRWQDLFFIGTDVVGSCQRLNGDYHLTKCLPTYAANGMVGAIALQDVKTISRGIVRALWNTAEGKPGLFCSRFYGQSTPVPENEQNALIDTLVLCGKQTGSPVFLPSPGERTEQTPTKLESKGSPFPFEYVDEAQGDKIVSFGDYSVLGYRVIY